MSDIPDFRTACPVPLQNYSRVMMAHGGGGKLMHDLLGKMILPVFQNSLSAAQHDSCVFETGARRLAFTTDSYVVEPLFFPGGNLGSLAVHGTVNDLAMSGARPLYLSASLIIEEGLEMETLWQLVNSMQAAAAACNVQIVTGDTKVVDKGKGDGLFVNTAGIGLIEHQLEICPRSIRPGDAIIVNGDLGRHGMAVMAQREGLQFESTIESDSAPLADIVLDLIGAKIAVHCLRDITRGGLTSVLNELSDAAGLGSVLEESFIPVRNDVRAACELLGLDPLQVACEGRFVLFVPASDAPKALSFISRHRAGQGACRIGTVVEGSGPPVLLKSSLGPTRVLDVPAGEQLPRIC